MSLTNPETVVTEQRLADFYQGILPYLGTNASFTVMSKFNKSDLYSTNEQIIGRWIDGKPLYQKVVEYTNVSVGTSWDKLDDASFASSMGMLVEAEATNVDSSGNIYPVNDILIRLASGVIQKKYNASATLPTLYVTYQYTKTSDVSVNIGSDTDYSETEKIVGTWIDGKPLYQRTVSTTTPATSQVVSLFDENNIANCYFVEGYFTDSNGYNVPVNRYDGGNTDVGVSIKSDGTQIYYGVGTNGGSKSIVFTVRYTKIN